EAEEILGGPLATATTLAGLMRRLMRKSDAGSTLFQPLIAALDESLNALDRTTEAVEQLKREMAFDPAELEQVEGRLFALRAAARKHHVIVDELSEVLAKYRAELAALQSGEATLAKLEADVEV